MRRHKSSCERSALALSSLSSRYCNVAASQNDGMVNSYLGFCEKSVSRFTYGKVSKGGAVTLGQGLRQGSNAEIECLDCERFGRYRIAGLIHQYGSNMRLPHLREMLAADCPRMRAASIYERCAARITKPAP
jgi:hypothetical protein